MQQKVFEINNQMSAVIRELGDHMPGGFFIYRAASPGELLYANKPVFDIFGCRDLEDFKKLTGLAFQGMVHPEDYRGVVSSIHEQVASDADNMVYIEYRIVRRDGAVRWVDDYGHFMEADPYGGIYTVFISDITDKREKIVSELEDHKAVIKELHGSIQRADAERLTFGRVAQALAGDYFSIYIVDSKTDHFTEYSADEASDRMGVEKEGDDFFNVSRKNMKRLMHPDDLERFLSVFTKKRVMSILERDGSFTTKYRLIVDGVPTYVSMKATLLEDEGGQHLVIGTNNINAQMQREEEFRRKAEQAHTQAKNDFLANMSHDIRTPMNAIVGYTNIAKSQWDKPEVVKDALDKIASSSHFLLSLINDILDISKIESGKLQLNLAPCDLAELFRRIEDITTLQAKKKSLHISYNHDSVRHFHVVADELRIEQILINIISNAIKYTPEGKCVDLIAQELEQSENGNLRYRFIVRDNGIGISEDYLPHIFESFTREEKTTVNRVQGTGLGLAITARIVKMMGGTISVKSRLGEGSAFTVDLELAKADTESAPAQAEAAPADHLEGRQILLVEDNDINAQIAIMILEQYGMKVDHAPNGLIGVDKVRESGDGFYDAVLMDIQMPVMNGYDAARSIRALPGTYPQKLPIIAMSANAYDEDVRACLQAGMDAHIAKPFQPADLIRILSGYISAGSV